MVQLRLVSVDDVRPSYLKWMNDQEVNQFMETRFTTHTTDDIEAFVTAMINSPDIVFLAIIHKLDLVHVGNIKLGPISNEHMRGDISFFIGEKRYWGMGIATAAVNLLTDYGLSQLRLNKICAGVYSNNPASQRIFEKIGYIREGILRSQFFSDGEWVDEICYAKFSNSE